MASFNDSSNILVLSINFPCAPKLFSPFRIQIENCLPADILEYSSVSMVTNLQCFIESAILTNILSDVSHATSCCLVADLHFLTLPTIHIKFYHFLLIEK